MQRVLKASVKVDHTIVGKIGPGLCVFVGVGADDEKKDVVWLAKKVARLRVFPDEKGKMSHSVIDERKGVLVVSQFTLFGDCREGCRPDFTRAAAPDMAQQLYQEFLLAIEKEIHELPQTGRFREKMEVDIVNDGPVTLFIDSRA